MKKIVVGISVVSLALLIAGCSSSTPTAAPAPAPQAQAPAPAPVDPPVQEPAQDAHVTAFLDLIQANFPGVDNAAALRLGHSVCSALNAGASLTDVGQVIINNGFSASDAGTLVGLSVGAFCPQYESDIEALS